MAPQQRKGKQGETQKKDTATDNAPQANSGATADPWADFKPGGKHAQKIQLGVLFFVATGSIINLYLYPPDSTKFKESYRAPLKWYEQFADKYVSFAADWGYDIPARVAEGLHKLHKKAGVDVHEARILEIGAGGGLVGIELQRLGYSHTLGLDISPSMAKSGNATGAYQTIATADAEDVPIEAIEIKNGSIDAVLCVGTTGYLARGLRGGEQDLERHFDGKDLPPEGVRVRALLQEWLRVLKPGGIVGLTLESQLAEVWEVEQKQLVSNSQWEELEVSDLLAFLPLHKDKYVNEARLRVYFYEKLH